MKKSKAQWLLVLVATLLILFQKLGQADGRKLRSHLGAGHARAASSVALPICKTTPYPQLCDQILATSSASAPLNRQIAAVSAYALRLTNTTYHAAARAARSAPKHGGGAVADCADLLSDAMDQLSLSIGRATSMNAAAGGYAARSQLMDVQVALSAAFTYQDTCSDELQYKGEATASPAAAAVLKQDTAASKAVNIAMALADTLRHRLSN